MSMTKNEMIIALVEDDIDTIQSGEVAYLADILRDGHKGYSKYTLKELRIEFKERFQDGRGDL